MTFIKMVLLKRRSIELHNRLIGELTGIIARLLDVEPARIRLNIEQPPGSPGHRRHSGRRASRPEIAARQ